MITKFNDFINKYNLENKATSNKKIQQIHSSLSLSDKVIYLKDGPRSIAVGIVNLLPSKGSHWVAYINENSFDSHACSPPEKVTKLITKRNAHCFLF